jgi:hypothetical protein
MARKDREHFDWLVANGFFEAAGGDPYSVTAKGREAADLGFSEYEPARKGTTPD